MRKKRVSNRKEEQEKGRVTDKITVSTPWSAKSKRLPMTSSVLDHVRNGLGTSRIGHVVEWRFHMFSANFVSHTLCGRRSIWWSCSVTFRLIDLFQSYTMCSTTIHVRRCLMNSTICPVAWHVWQFSWHVWHVWKYPWILGMFWSRWLLSVKMYARGEVETGLADFRCRWTILQSTWRLFILQ